MAQTDDTTERDYTDKDYALANKIICAVRVRFGLLTEVEPHDLYAIDRLIATTVAADREEERKHHEWESLLAEALAQDWPLSRVSLYDEEGVEGWQLIGTDWGQEWS